MTTSNITQTSAYSLRLLAYSNERFPLWQVAGQLPMFATAFFYGQILAGHDPKITVALVAGFFAFVAYTLMVRCIDDNKDAAHDNEHYPDRVLQRGLVTFTQLKIIAVLCLVLSVIISLAIDGGFGLVTMWWFIIFATNNLVQYIQIRWASIGAWIESRRVLLALSVIPFWGFGSVWITQMGSGDSLVTSKVWWIVVTWCVAALLLEIARKSRTPEDERATVVDYTQTGSTWTRSLGLNGTVAVLLVASLLITALEAGVLHSVHAGSLWSYSALLIIATLPVGAAVRFVLRKDRHRVKDVAEVAAGLWVLGQVVVASALLVTGAG